MADPLTIIGGIAAILQISATVVSLIKATKGASNDRQKILAEVNSTTALCQTLNDCVDINGIDSWTDTLKVLSQTENGPLSQFKQCLEYLQRKLSAKAAAIKWPFNKQSVQDILATIERQKSLISLALTNDNLRLSAAIHDGVQEVTKAVDSLRVSQDRDRRRASLSQLTTIDFEATHADIASRRARDTGGWLLESPEFVSWEAKESFSVLCCLGIPGSGKTILTSLVIDRLREKNANDPSAGLAGIYCSYQNQPSILDLMASILRQLHETLDVDPPPPPLNLDKVRASLATIAISYSKITLVIDALDECSERAILLKELQMFAGSVSKCSSKTTLHIMITGRGSVTSEIERIMKPEFSLEICSRDDDVRMFLLQMLNESGQLSEWVHEVPGFEALIVEAILARLSGMFLLARLHVDTLSQIPTRRGVRKALEALPEGINDTYDDAWNRICTQKSYQADLGKSILMWIVHATRPLRLHELQYALAIEKDDEEMDPEGLLSVKTLISFCAGLVVVDEQRGLVGLVHFTTQEYFAERKDALFSNAHEKIAATCMMYLRMRPFMDEGASADSDKFYKRRCTCHLLGYAAVNWGVHAAIAKSEIVMDHALALLNSERVRAAAWQALQLNIVGAQALGSEWPPQGDDAAFSLDYFNASRGRIGALHVAAYFGLRDVVQTLLNLGGHVDELDGAGRTPLHWALIGQQNTMLDFLLENGAKANAAAEYGDVMHRRWHEKAEMRFPLALAAAYDNVNAIGSLLRYGADINRNICSATALSIALFYLCHAATRFLLSNGADINIVDGKDLPLQGSGSSELLKVVIDAGANIHVKNSALTSAASRSNYEKVRFFLENGADANGTERTPWPYKEAGSYLFEEAEDGTLGETALVASVNTPWGRDRSDSLRCLLLLIDSGAEVDRVCPRRWRYAMDFKPLSSYSWLLPEGRKTTALHKAAYYGRLDMIRTLTERGADVNRSLGEQHTPLSSALGSESFDENPPEWDIASSIHVKATVELLIELGADPNLCNREDIGRIKQLLNLSLEECNAVAALQPLLEQPSVPNEWLQIYHKSFRDRIRELKELIAGGVDPNLCCKRNQQYLSMLLGLSDQEIDEMDMKRMLRLSINDEYFKAPI